MADAPEAVEERARERGFLALLLLVGGAAIVVGLYELWRTDASSVSAVLDLSLGASVLLVTWVFLAPTALAEFSGSREPGFERVARDPEPSAVGPAPRIGVSSARPHPPPDPIIPKWADPLVPPRPRAVSGRSTEAPASWAELGVPPDRSIDRSVAPTAPSEPPREAEPAPGSTEAEIPEDPFADLFEEPSSAGHSSAPESGSTDMLRELDRIELELRSDESAGPNGSPAGGTATVRFP